VVVKQDKNVILEGACDLVFGSPESWLEKTRKDVLASFLYRSKIVRVIADEVHMAYKWYVQ
jgi:superfamily II DNA helicase RecQ